MFYIVFGPPWTLDTIGFLNPNYNKNGVNYNKNGVNYNKNGVWTITKMVWI
jgi:hypothetical protein